MTEQDQNNFKAPRMRSRYWMFPIFFIAGAFAFGMAVMLLWNAILPDIAAVKPINYWQALGLLALCRILFGGWRGGRPMRPRGQRGAGGPPMLREKWMNMSEEERTAFKAEWRRRCGKN